MSETIRGLSSLMRKLDQLGGNSKEVLNKAVEDCTVFVRDDARKRCPEDTGDLRKSIDYKVEVSGSSVTGTVYTNMEYAPYVEFGTGTTGQTSNSNTNVSVSYRQNGWTYYSDELGQFVYTEGMVARPYMYPALHDNKQRIRNKICKDVRKEIERLAKK